MWGRGGMLARVSEAARRAYVEQHLPGAWEAVRPACPFTGTASIASEHVIFVTACVGQPTVAKKKGTRGRRWEWPNRTHLHVILDGGFIN